MTARASSFTRALRRSIAGVCAALALASCDHEPIRETHRVVEEAGTAIATLTELSFQRRAGGTQLQRIWKLPEAPDEPVLENAILDDDGFVVSASFRHETHAGRRYVELKREEGHALLESRGDGERLVLPDAPIVLVNLRDRVKKPAPSMVLLDLENARFDVVTALPSLARRERLARSDDPTPIAQAADSTAARALPGAGRLVVDGVQPAIRDDDPVLPVHRTAAPLIESASPRVIMLAKTNAPSLPPVEAARVLLGVVHVHVRDDVKGPPSAINAVLFGGGVEHAALLEVALLRALGHPARVVCGWAADDASATWTTWAQVHDGTRWHDVDPDDKHFAHVALYEGIRGPLTTGRGVGTPRRLSLDVVTAPVADGMRR